MYEMLSRGRWLIADTCPLLIAAIPSRYMTRRSRETCSRLEETHWMTQWMPLDTGLTVG